MMNRWRFFLFSFLILTQNSFALNPSIDTSYLEELVQKAKIEKLSNDPYWRILLHYRHHWYSDSKSDIKAKTFFNSLKGRNDPEAELEATLRAFYTTFEIDPTKKDAQPLQCLFIDRYHWLKERLQIDVTRAPEATCTDYENWKHALDPSSITLVFSSYYMNNPSSAFGHTLLRLNHRRKDGSEPLLDYGVSYAANPTTSNALFYGILGLTGGFDGVFSNIPYFLKVSEYNDIESRELWEYDLNFTPVEIDRMMAHLWTVGHFSTPYYFFDQNCSYMLLTILDSGRPSLKLGDESDKVWVIPADTIRSVAEKKGLVSHVSVRPSLTDRVSKQLAALDADERTLFYNLFQASDKDARETLKLISRRKPESARKIYDLALDYFRFLSPTEKKKLSPELKNLQSETLGARAEIDATSPDVAFTPLETEVNRPDGGHATGRMTVGYGHQALDGNFLELGVRPAFQDLNAATQGYPKNVQIDILDGVGRYYPEKKRVRVERFSLANIVSLEPYDPLFKKFSWSMRVGADPIRDIDCADCIEYRLNAGIGYSLSIAKPLVIYALAKADFGYASSLTPRYRLGPAGESGALIHMGESLSLLGTLTYRHPLLGSLNSFFDKSAELRLSLSQNIDLRLAWDSHPTTNQEKVLLNVYF